MSAAAMPAPGRMHAPDPEDDRVYPRGRRSLCGMFGETPVTDDEDEITCGHCLRLLGLPRRVPPRTRPKS